MTAKDIDKILSSLDLARSRKKQIELTKAQANNTRKTRMITYNGETHSVSEWARIIGVKQSTLNMRLNKYGWSVEEALGKSVKHNA